MSRISQRKTIAARFSRDWLAASVGLLRKDEGSNLLEYGLVAILFLTLIFGIMGLGQMLYSYHFVVHAAKEATRFAAVHGSTCTSDGSCTAAASPSDTAPVTDFVTSITPEGIASSQVTVTPTWPCTSAAAAAACTTACYSAVTEGVPPHTTTIGPALNYPGCTVQVQVSYNFTWLFPMSPVTLSSSSQMVIAH
jgi:Flp pilus assembly protein TadG